MTKNYPFVVTSLSFCHSRVRTRYSIIIGARTCDVPGITRSKEWPKHTVVQNGSEALALSPVHFLDPGDDSARDRRTCVLLQLRGSIDNRCAHHCHASSHAASASGRRKERDSCSPRVWPAR